MPLFAGDDEQWQAFEKLIKSYSQQIFLLEVFGINYILCI